MKKKFLKKFLAGFVVITVFSGALGPVSLIFAADKTIADNGLVLEKLKNKQLEKTGQLRDFDNEEKVETFSADQNLKKTVDIKELQKQNYVEGEVLVKFKEQKINLEYLSGRTKANQFAISKNLDKKEDIRKSNISVLKIKDMKTVEEKIAELKNDSDVEYVQPNFQYYPLEIDTNDTHKNKLWGLDNTGQTVNTVAGTLDADIDAPEAWAMLNGTENDVIVAVIDSGVAYNHSDLADNMWDGSSCLDDSGNFLGGCLHGYDYEDGDLDPLPTNNFHGMHGTYVAGVIGATQNNNKGVIGVAPNVKIMALKSRLTSADNVSSINFAKHNGAKVINASWSGKADNCSAVFDPALYEAIRNFDGLFIAGAGNGGENHNGSTYFGFPADYGHTTSCWAGLDNVISVAATDQNDNLADFSDYGEFIDIGAPGVNIYSTVMIMTTSEIFSEDFESVTMPEIGSKFTQDENGTWGTLPSSDDSNIFISGDYAHWGNYQNNIESDIDSLVIDLSENPNSYLQFDCHCDTEEGYDGLALFFYNGSDWEVIDYFTGYNYGERSYSLSNYAIDNFQFSFGWRTDESNESIINWGCLVDDIKIVNADSVSSSYNYASGTSMATPHVAGLAALIWGYDSELSYSDIKNVILATGDSLDSLDGKTATGERINAFNALDFLASEVEVSGVIIEDTTWKSINSPYIVTGNILVNEGVTLTIEPGVVVKFEDHSVADYYGYYIKIDGTLVAKGTKEK